MAHLLFSFFLLTTLWPVIASVTPLTLPVISAVAVLSVVSVPASISTITSIVIVISSIISVTAVPVSPLIIVSSSATTVTPVIPVSSVAIVMTVTMFSLISWRRSGPATWRGSSCSSSTPPPLRRSIVPGTSLISPTRWHIRFLPLITMPWTLPLSVSVPLSTPSPHHCTEGLLLISILKLNSSFTIRVSLNFSCYGRCFPFFFSPISSISSLTAQLHCVTTQIWIKGGFNTKLCIFSKHFMWRPTIPISPKPTTSLFKIMRFILTLRNPLLQLLHGCFSINSICTDLGICLEVFFSSKSEVNIYGIVPHNVFDREHHFLPHCFVVYAVRHFGINFVNPFKNHFQLGRKCYQDSLELFIVLGLNPQGIANK